jgi:hypothetical protein
MMANKEGFKCLQALPGFPDEEPLHERIINRKKDGRVVK